MKPGKATDMRSFILREARLDVLHPERSEFSRHINKMASDFAREWERIRLEAQRPGEAAGNGGRST